MRVEKLILGDMSGGRFASLKEVKSVEEEDWEEEDEDWEEEDE